MSRPIKPLIIAEKPAAARAIAEALGGFSARAGYMESADYLLSWAIGHLVEQLSPEEYDGRWKRWSMQSLPILPDHFRVKVTPATRSQFELLAGLARTAPELINACDAGREGELIFRYICEAASVHSPAKRLWISSLTNEAIRKGFACLRPAAEYERLYQSALCRARGDWLVGMNASRAFTVKWGELLSVGRVQTPTLALIVRREREIESFVPQQYWELFADFVTPDQRAYRGKWIGPDGSRLKTAEMAVAIAQRVKNQSGLIESAEEKPVSERPPQLHDLTALQREANRRFGLTAAATLKAAQSLYEEKLITYPRTDSHYLSRDLLPGLPAILRAVGSQTSFRSLVAMADPSLVHAENRRVVDDSKVTEHHAIIPTTEKSRALTGTVAKVYGLIVRRFISQFFPDARTLDLEVITRVGDHPDRFRSRGRTVLALGWRTVEQELRPQKSDGDEEELSPLPLLKQGEAVRAEGLETKECSTKPPRRFTEASLLSAMELAGKRIEDDSLKEAMKGRGLGTPATRASIIERLKAVGYIAIAKKSLVATPKGHLLVGRAESAGAEVLLSAELTGDWERRIADIQAGNGDSQEFMALIRGLALQVVEWVRAADGGASPIRRRSPSQPDGRAAPAVNAAFGARAPGEVAPAAAPIAHPAPAASDAFKCPQCGRAVIKGSRGWSCVNSDCSLRIPGYLCNKVIDGALAEVLLTKGKTPLIAGFTSSRTGKLFSAFLVLKAGKVQFEFPSAGSVKSKGRS